MALSLTGLVVGALAGCGDEGASSGLAGDYEMVALAVESGGCTGAGSAQAVPEELRYFELGDEEIATGPLVAYYPCTAPGMCEETFDLYRSFGWSDEGFVTVIASAVQPPCTLGYRVRTLRELSAGRVQIVETLQQEVDETLSGAACAQAEAKARRAQMPCVERREWTAERR